MELSQLKVFTRVVQAGSFTRAAEQLGSQKAYVSRVVSQLEQELGLRLLERSTRALSLTEVGREFYERAINILSAVEATESLAQQVQGEPRGILKLSCGTEFGMIAVSDWINGYLKRFPQVQVEADFSNRLIDLVHEGFDLAIRLGELPDSSLVSRSLGKLHYGLFSASDYLFNSPRIFHPKELEEEHLIVFNNTRRTSHWELSQGESLVQVQPKQVRLRVNNSFAARHAAIQGLGIVQLPLVVAQPALAAGQLKPVLPAWQPPIVPIHAVFASSRYLTPKVRCFIDYALEACANWLKPN